MKTRPDHIHQLMTEKLAAVISATDEHYLDELIERDPVVRQKWEALQQACMPSGAEKSAERLRSWPATAGELLAGKTVPLRARNLAWKRFVGAAAAIALLAVAGWLLFQDRAGSGNPAGELVSRPGDLEHIQLELATGKKVDPSQMQDSLVMDGIRLTRNEETLTYRPAGSLAGLNTPRVPARATYSIQLADSTRVWLNSMTTLRFPFEFSGSSREISIEREVYLKAAENSLQPFIVHLPKSDVLVTGTEFNVNTYQHATDRIALVEGSVRLTAGTATTSLTPGTQAVFNPGSGWTTSAFDPDQVLGWRQGVFYFYDTSLEEIAGVITRWFGIVVVIDNPSIRNRRFAGMLDKNQPLEVFLDNMKAIAGIPFYYTDNRRELHFTTEDGR